jgi:signal peptidase I
MSTAIATDELMPVASLRPRSATLRKLAGLAVVGAFIGAIGLGVLYARSAGFGLISVHGGSMGDTIPTGSLVIAKSKASTDVDVGDVILIRQQAQDGSTSAPKLHRVIALEKRDGQVLVQTKGDGNADPDPGEYVLREQTLVEQWHVSRLGYWISFAGTPQGWALVSALPFVTVAAIIIASIWRRKPAPA